MFLGSTSFNGDLSKWDASSVNDMDDMFFGAKTFKRKLCTAAWIHSKASKDGMFEGSSGSISSRVCSTTRRAFSPQSRGELKSAVSECLESDGDDGQYGPIGEWDVSRVTNMRRMFSSAGHFTGDISKWDASRVNDMSHMFFSAESFKSDLSQWDVLRVVDMSHMFSSAASFDGDVSNWNVSSLEDMSCMFWGATSFNGDLSKCVIASDVVFVYMCA